MIDIDTIAKLKSMRLSGMATALEEIDGIDRKGSLTTAEVIKMAVEREWERRQNTRLARLRRNAHLPYPGADIHDIKVFEGRKIDIEQVTRLAIGNYITKHQDVIIQGPTGAGKTYLACALGNKAVQQFKNVVYFRAAELFDQFTIAEKAGTRGQLLDKLVKYDLLIIDDWFLTAPNRAQVQNLHQLVDRRTQIASTIYCTQLPPSKWHDRMEEKILADAIIDRITASAVTVTLDATKSLRHYFANNTDY
ncbi:MAG: ATP-binding protein [Promicromonosporaceae bacterium]|jgi:DNA replication protein DnaC|nr:ATP-binding protein [Promicromonosporaceae bacterium]